MNKLDAAKALQGKYPKLWRRNDVTPADMIEYVLSLTEPDIREDEKKLTLFKVAWIIDRAQLNMERAAENVEDKRQVPFIDIALQTLASLRTTTFFMFQYNREPENLADL